MYAGEYGESIERIDKIHQPDKYLLEQEFEKVRKIFFPHKPSRLKSIFLLQSQGDAKLYKIHVELQSGKKYERFSYKVQILDASKPIHIGSTSLFNQYCLKGLHEKAAYHYFNSEVSSLIYDDGSLEQFPQEVICESDVLIIGCV